MERATKAWLDEDRAFRDGYMDSLPRLKLPYTIYGCMLLLPHNALHTEAWSTAIVRAGPNALERLYALLAYHLKITHIAMTHPIPPSNSDELQSENIIRSPSNFEPLYGDFGPATASCPPIREDFDVVFWVTAKQNGIYQTWAPRWTMFSRGNISEKARILDLESVAQAVEHGRDDGQGCSAVDLYAGIGYFAFSYLKAGVRRVLCWDLNEWSCEGMRRGATRNGWEAASFEREEDIDELAESEARLLIFNESNEEASERVKRMREALPPVRHVNCGLLPTSRGSWQTAIDVLDSDMGGWVHVHENFGIAEIEEKAEGVREAFQRMLTGKREGSVELEHVNRLKSYAPGVIHCVLDIYIPPRTLE